MTFENKSPSSDPGTASGGRNVQQEPTRGRIVGIGASAGSLESLEQLFDTLPPDTGMAFVVVQHPSPDLPSVIDELIARHSEMPVVLAEDNMRVCANHIYLIPPRKQMILRDRHLVVADKEPLGFSLPIDTFFRSLAQDIGDKAVAIVLSGSGSDGSRGVVEVKRAGGLVLAETAASARFDSMPVFAAATGAVDHAHPPRDLARVLCGLAPRECIPDHALRSHDPAIDVVRLLRDHFGIDFSLYKTPTEARPIVAAKPLFPPRSGARQFLVTFQSLGSPDLPVERAEPPALPFSEASRDHPATLEAELACTRETLQTTNEELQTSNEELQSTNEELCAVNAEYQRKIMELKELNTDMAHLLEGTDVGTVFLDRELRIRRFTSRIASVFRIQPLDIGRRISDFSHNIERPHLIDEIEQVRATGKLIEDEVRDRNAVPYFLRILPYRISRGDHDPESAPIDGVVLTLTDISALDRARSHLAELSAIVESSEDAIIGMALAGTITAWNRGAERLYGYSAEQAIGRNIRILMQQGYEDQLHELLGRCRRGERVEHVLTLCRHSTGTNVEVSTTLSPIHDRRGLVAGVSAIGRDISALLAAQRELEQRQCRFTTLLEQAEEGARRREQFIAMLSHELRNPLAAVMNATTLIKRQPDGDSIARCQGVIERQARHMKRLLDDLLDVSRITRGKFQVLNDDIDLRASIEAAIESTSPLYAERGVKLDHSLPHQPMPVRGDAGRLVQVVVNLLSNAANYSPRASLVRLLVTIEGGHGVLRVIDHGVGIEAGLQNKIFDLFVQSEQRLDRSRGGLGVGLSLARNIIELHGGTIEVHSEGPGRGSDFKVSIPLLPPSILEWGPQRTPARRNDRCRIVLVDDQEDSREMLRMLLESRDHEVIDVQDGPTAIEVITRERPDVAFIDIGLPMMNGYEVAQQIRNRPELEDVLLVALTGYGAPSDISAARAAGFNEHVIKPAELAKLERILASRRPGVTDYTCDDV